MGLDPYNIYIGRNSIGVGLVVGMILPRLEANVVSREVTLELQVVIDNLLKHVLFHV